APDEQGRRPGPDPQSPGAEHQRRAPHGRDSSRSRRSRRGAKERIGGIAVKFRRGGGEVVAHSSVCPSHGSSPAGSRLRSDTTRLTTKTRIPAAITNAPLVARTLSVVKPASDE